MYLSGQKLGGPGIRKIEKGENFYVHFTSASGPF